MGERELPTDADEFYRTLVENSAEGLLTIDAESRIVYANPAIEEILGYAPAELIGSSKMKIIPERLQPVHAEALAAYVESGERHVDWDGIELPALHEDGHEVPTLISLREHEFGGDQYFTGIIRDVTERRERERQLERQTERLDQFADILAHDIRNPLSVAQGYTEVAREEDDAPELDRVADALDRIDALVDDVLALSKQGRRIGETERVDLETIVRESWSGIDAEGATLRVEGDLGSVETDRSRFRELLSNLYRISVEHADGAVTVTVARTPEGFSVADDGPGIPAEEREQVFDHGYSTREAGTGYGLSIVRQIVEAHGWTVDVTESDEGGARFEIDFGE
jgi:PAS domain S-box-containing protein